MIERCDFCGKEHEVTTIKLPSGTMKTCPAVVVSGADYVFIQWPPKIDDETRGKWERNEYGRLVDEADESMHATLAGWARDLDGPNKGESHE